MDPKAYLNSIKHIDQDIQSRQTELDALKETIAVRTSTLTEDKVQESHAGSYDDRYMKLVETSDEINDKIDELFDLKVEASLRIDQLDNRTYQVILRERYINLKTWEEIACLLNYDERHLKRLHGYALLEFDKVLNMS